MQAKVQKVGNDYVVMLPAQVVDDLRLVDGSYVEVEKVDGAAGAPVLEIKRLTDDEAREIFDKIEPFHRNTFAELAK
jgi:antitoxin component of MazEF toxin-antitoxin module